MPDKVVKSDAEWRAQLSAEEFHVTRQHGTERAFTGRTWDEKRKGRYDCVCCGQPLFSSETKYDSGTGWPSFWKSLPGAIGTKDDRKLFALRTECHCARCGSHLGHIFDDGPQPTGKRHCLNGVSLVFKPA